MKALIASDYGLDRLAVTDIEEPTPGPGQVLVRIAAAAVNPIDHKLVSGDLRAVMPLTLPAGVGVDGAGTVAAVGAGVDRYAGGDVFANGEPGDLDDLGSRAAAWRLPVEISQVYPLDRAPQALADLANLHTRGKLVVQVR